MQYAEPMPPSGVRRDRLERGRNYALLGIAATACLVLSFLLGTVLREGPVARPSDLVYIRTNFENASPLYWETAGKARVHVYFPYDQERASPNRANGHWFFELQTAPQADLTVVLHNFDNIWNGRKDSPLAPQTACFVSDDAQVWHCMSTGKARDNSLRLRVTVPTGRLYVARLEPYRLSDLEALEGRMRDDARVEITTIGKTVEGRDLEMMRVGRPEAPCRVLLRARAHPWEAGGSWVVQGLVERLLADDEEAQRYLAKYCVYVMPMANKDGVVHGRTRFNLLGADLNRGWDKPVDPAVNPENHALESWLTSMAAKEQSPHLMIDLHNDEAGKLNIARPSGNIEGYLGRMQLFAAMLRQYSWFTERSTDSAAKNPGSIADGLLTRFGINACVLELNANWITRLNTYPSAEQWKFFGAQLGEVLFHYAEEVARNSPESGPSR